MKKLIAILLTVVLILSFAACGKNRRTCCGMTTAIR